MLNAMSKQDKLSRMADSCRNHIPINFGEKMQYYCELCDTFKLAERRKDNIYVCDDCNKKYPLKDIDEK